MATLKQLDSQGEAAVKLYKQIAASSKDYNSRRKERTEELRTTLAPIWEALAQGKTVNGCNDKLSWCKWANPSAKHPERYFYAVMSDKKGLKSLQSHRPLDAGIEKFLCDTKEATVVVQILGDGVKGRFSVSVEAKDLPIKDQMPCGCCTWVTGVDMDSGKFKRHVPSVKNGASECKGSGKSVRWNLLERTVERALFHKLKGTLASMRLWNDSVKKLYEDEAKTVKYREPYRYSA
jgi:hypothetical protein